MFSVCFVLVLPLLQGLMSQSSPENVYNSALKCFASWVQFGVPLTEVDGLVIKVFEAVHQEVLFDTAIDALIKIFSHGDNHR